MRDIFLINYRVVGIFEYFTQAINLVYNFVQKA